MLSIWCCLLMHASTVLTQSVTGNLSLLLTCPYDTGHESCHPQSMSFFCLCWCSSDQPPSLWGRHCTHVILMQLSLRPAAPCACACLSDQTFGSNSFKPLFASLLRLCFRNAITMPVTRGGHIQGVTVLTRCCSSLLHRSAALLCCSGVCGRNLS
jgi:hypothetical protein